MAKKLNEKDLLARAEGYLPKGIPADAIIDVEVDTDGNTDRLDGISYWVYLRDGFKTEKGRGCHTVHEDNLKDLKTAMQNIVKVEEK